MTSDLQRFEGINTAQLDAKARSRVAPRWFQDFPRLCWSKTLILDEIQTSILARLSSSCRANHFALGDRDLEACSSIFIFLHCLPLFDSLLALPDDVTSMTTEEPLFHVDPAGTTYESVAYRMWHLSARFGVTVND